MRRGRWRPTSTASEDARPVAQRLGLGRPPRRLRQRRRARGDAGDRLPARRDEPLAGAAGAGHGQRRALHHPGVAPLRPGDDLSGHAAQPVLRARRGRPLLRPRRRAGAGRRAMCSRGIAMADVDGDGGLDFAVANQWEPSYFFRNEQPAPGRVPGLHRAAAAGAGPGGRRRLPALAAPGGRAPQRHGLRCPTAGAWSAQVDGGSGHSGKRSAGAPLRPRRARPPDAAPGRRALARRRGPGPRADAHADAGLAHGTARPGDSEPRATGKAG